METLLYDVLTMRLASFNVGVTQDSLVGRNARRVMASLDRVSATCVHDGSLDILSMCEVGGHREGLTTAAINATDLAVLGQGPAQCSNTQNYLSLRNFRADASQPDVQQLQSTVQTLTCYKLVRALFRV